MGVPFDSRMQYDYPGIDFTPFVGCKVYNPQGHTIDTYVGQLGDSWEISSRQVSTNDLYLNLRTGRAYTWNGTEMVNAHLSPDVTTGSIPACDHDFSQDNTTYHVTEPIVDQTIIIGSGCTLEFYGNGCLVGCTLNGRGTKIVPNGTQQIFDNCTFNTQPQVDTFVDSHLYATNFGAISDMHTVDKGAWQFKGLNIEHKIVRQGIYVPVGDDEVFSGIFNDVAWSQMVGFLKNSNGISVEFNGKFMGKTVQDVSVRDCRNLELYGGTMLRGLAIIDCQYVDIHDMRFVGVHEVHDFPTIFHNKTAYVEELQQRIENETDEEKKNELITQLNDIIQNTYNCMYLGDIDHDGIAADGTETEEMGALISCGLSGDGIKVLRKNADFADCHVSIHDCHFEMRQGGVGFSSKYTEENGSIATYLPLSHGEVRDCTFSHIYFQPVGSHAEHVTIENIQSEYCMQGLDISTSASNTVARNCVFRKCSCGPKQEAHFPFTPLTHDNVVENCLFEMTDDYVLKNALRYILTVNAGLANDTFVMRNCQFTVNSAYRFGGMVFRSWRTVLDNVRVKVDVQCAENYDILYMIGMGGATPHSPIVEMNHVDIECNARIESLAFRGVPLSDAGPLQLHMSHVHVHGTGRANILFEKMDHIVLNKSVFNLASTSFVRYSHDVAIHGCRVRQIAGTGILAYTITDTDCLIEDSDIEVGSRLLWLQQNGGSIIVRRNRIRCAPLISCKWDGSAHIEITGNDITDTSGSGTQLIHPIDQSGYDFWTDGGQNELIVNNNVVRYPGSGTKNVVYPARYADYAHLFYSNFLDHGIKPFNTGTAGERPTSPWQGMLHLEGSSYFAYRLTQWLELITAVPNL